MASQNLSLADTVVGEKTIRRFGICPILTGQGDAPSNFIGELFEKLSQPLGVAFISELAPCQFTADPEVGLQTCQSSVLFHGRSSPRFVAPTEVFTLRLNHLPQLVLTCGSMVFVGNCKARRTLTTTVLVSAFFCFLSNDAQFKHFSPGASGVTCTSPVGPALECDVLGFT